MFFCFVGLVRIQPGIFLMVEKNVLPSPLMKTKFYEKINVIIANKSSNCSFLSKEKYELHVQQITELKRGERRKEPKEY